MWLNHVSPVNGPRAIEGNAELPIRDKDYQRFLATPNGGYAFDRALHIYGYSTASSGDDAIHRSQHLRGLYDQATPAYFFFAEDTFGNQFGYVNGDWGWLNIESGEWEHIATTFNAWAQALEERPNYYTGRSLLLAWEAVNGPLPNDHRLCPKVPFVLGGDFLPENLHSLPWAKNIEFISSIYHQIKKLPDGTPYKLVIGDKPPP